MKLLRIAQIAPIVWRTPPKRYGGIERVVYYLTEELVKRGHKVTLFATGDSQTSGRLSYVFPNALMEARIGESEVFNKWRIFHTLQAYKRAEEFDIIHDHTVVETPRIETPVVFTHHGLISKVARDLSVPNIYSVAISHAQSKEAPGAKISSVIHNGLPMENYPFSEKPMDYLLFVGRFSKQKGAHHAVRVALELNMKLILVAKKEDRDEKYFNQYIKPNLINRKIEWIGEVDDKHRNYLMCNAKALLHPAIWEEPFGLNMIEAMACGCPVVGFKRGSIPEIIEDGKTGFIVKNVSQMISAIKKIDSINRLYTREYSLSNFSAKKMADRYEKLYYEILRKEEIILPQRDYKPMHKELN
jgi:glycosyltransferase involved in cell wall biosynthesis